MILHSFTLTPCDPRPWPLETLHVAPVQTAPSSMIGKNLVSMTELTLLIFSWRGLGRRPRYRGDHNKRKRKRQEKRREIRLGFSAGKLKCVKPSADSRVGVTTKKMKSSRERDVVIKRKTRRSGRSILWGSCYGNKRSWWVWWWSEATFGGKCMKKSTHDVMCEA